MSFGFVYALSNTEMPDILKIGFTKNPPSQRARELSRGTGVPAEYQVEFYIETSNPEQVESIAHARLANLRTNQLREFFRVGVFHAACAIYGADENFWVEDPVHFTDYMGDRLRCAMVWVDLRCRVIAAHGGACIACGAKDGLLVLHKTTHELGGSNNESNLVCMCERCADHGHISFQEAEVLSVRRDFRKWGIAA